ncbi:isocitrate/isopropylmalate family dehydrogenase, partial [Salmonella enterica]|uniref:isocitrate/isopropylmalate family dehydrogenase n=1 Tax=Salmonella enterica TaxID=28901 RepID=UPI00398C6C98
HGRRCGSASGRRGANVRPATQPEDAALMPRRKHLQFFRSRRQGKHYTVLEAFCPLRADIAANGFDLLFVRELTGGILFLQTQARQ